MRGPLQPSFMLLLLANISFSAYAGHMVASVEKEWNIISNGTLRDAFLNGSFLLETDSQRILEMKTTDGELVREGDEVRLIYHSASLQTPKKITATAIVEVMYQPSLPENPPLPNQSFPGSGLTNYTPAMASFARSHTSESRGQLDAMASLASWVHKNVEYDTSYWGRDSPATDVYSSRRAVCVGYTHLLLALANSLGIENRYVSGYVFSEGWQQHAWAELNIGGQWVSADPTFEEFGYLDARRVAGSYSPDQSGSADRLFAKGGPFSFDTVVRIRISESSPFPPITNSYAAFDGTEFSVVIANPGSNYVTPTYTVAFPPHVHGVDSGIATIPPGGRKVLSYYLNLDSLGSGSAYQIPYSITMQGTELSDKITYSPHGSAGPGQGLSPSSACGVAFLLLSAFLLTAATRQKN